MGGNGGGAWKLVLASAVGFSFFSVLLAGTGLFFEPLRKEFGWNRSLLSAGPAIATLVTALLSPFYGALIDRVGSRRLALPGIVMVMASMSAFAFASGSRAPVDRALGDLWHSAHHDQIDRLDHGGSGHVRQGARACAGHDGCRHGGRPGRGAAARQFPD